jgi:hypothetical protein
MCTRNTASVVGEHPVTGIVTVKTRASVLAKNSLPIRPGPYAATLVLSEHYLLCLRLEPADKLTILAFSHAAVVVNEMDHFARGE